jgi:alkanesulfonate monooxygenase SsuD/methylene tetrahydromethanopterin reductase-like flavin-dependent oxidoreductase (luciferase family)
MKIGILLAFQSGGVSASSLSGRDAEVYKSNLRIADLLEPLGFDSVFNVEHHGTSHHITGNGLDFLKYMAARTERIELGTSVMVLPWWNPLRAAEELSFLDHSSRGRKIHVGVGRGAAPSEYKYLGIDMSEARDRFKEGVEILRLALSEERFSYDGKIFQLDNVTSRPRPLSSDLGATIYAGVVQQSSIEVAANLGLHMMHTGGSSLEEGVEAVATFNGIRAKNGWAPMRPIICLPGFCASTSGAAEEAAYRGFGNYIKGAMSHYDADHPEKFEGIKGYEDYAANKDSGTPFLAPGAAKQERGAGELTYIQNGIFGSPSECIEKITAVAESTKTDHLILLVHQAGLSVEETEASLRLFSKEVLPAVRHLNNSPLV